MKSFIYKFLLVKVTVALLATNVFAQQDPMYTQYMFDKMLINPAYVGSSNWIVGTLKHRSQFLGIEGGPSTQTFTAHMPIQSKNLGVGVKFINDKIAEFGRTHVGLNGAYHIRMRDAKLSFGLEAGIINQNINYNNLVRYHQEDNAITAGDKNTMLDVSFGSYYQNDRLYGGISLMHLLPNKSATDFTRLNKNFNLFGGYVYDIVPKMLTVDPSILIKKVYGAPWQMDINANFVYQDKYTLGASWRSGDALAIVMKAVFKEQYRIAYSYDITTSGLSSYSGGAHEIMLSYGIKVLPPPTLRDIHPRYYF